VPLRVAAGNFGDCKSLRNGVSELRIDWGPGYRVYYAMLERTSVLLLCGGDKRR
jgi:putative addiction module killer protein